MSYLADELLQCETRAGLLRSLLVERRPASVSELARRCRLSPRAVGREVEHLARLGLVHVTAVGPNHLVEADWENPACELLERLLTLETIPKSVSTQALRESLVAHGAPLVGVSPVAHHALEATLVQGLQAARKDGMLLRVLPVVLAKNRQRVDWVTLKEEARKSCLKAELGFVLELTGTLLSDEPMKQLASELKDRRRTRMHYLPEPKNQFERQVAEEASPRIARSWGFFMNVSEASFRSLLSKHCPELHLAEDASPRVTQ
jgi:hypothetical protein